MIKIEFSGESFVEVRRQIQEFAVAHLNAKFNVPPDVVGGPNTGIVGPGAPEPIVTQKETVEKEVATGKRKSRGRPKKGEHAAQPAPKVEVSETGAMPDTAPEHVPDAIAKAAEEPERVKTWDEAAADPPVSTAVAGQPPKLEVITNPKTLADCTKSLQDVFDKKGMDFARKLLSSFGAGKVRELREDQYETFITACKAASI